MTTDERFERIETDLAGTAEILRTVAETQDRQAEKLSQLDGLIRTIAADHSNGKKH
jgi:hypothetical protein